MHHSFLYIKKEIPQTYDGARPVKDGVERSGGETGGSLHVTLVHVRYTVVSTDLKQFKFLLVEYMSSCREFDK